MAYFSAAELVDGQVHLFRGHRAMRLDALCGVVLNAVESELPPGRRGPDPEPTCAACIAVAEERRG